MTKLPSMPFFPADFFADTEHLSPSARHAYLFLLCHAWLRGAKLPNDDAALARMAGFRMDHWRKIKAEVMAFWHVDNDGMLWNMRQRNNFEVVNATRELNKANGALGGRPKSLFSNRQIKANGFDFKRLQNQNQNIKDSFNGKGRKEGGWVPTKRIGDRTFRAGELAPKYPGQDPKRWEILKPEDCA